MRRSNRAVKYFKEADMHCPNCGTKASAAQRFCRACGFGLEKVELLITEQKTAVADQTTEAPGSPSSNWLRKLEKGAWVALLALGGILVSLLLWAIIFKVMIEEGKIWEGSMVLMILCVVAMALFLAYMHVKKSTSARSNPSQRLPEAAETAKMLAEPNFEVADGVTEHTTTRLEEKTMR
jgi:ribosomal protein L37E